MWKRARPNRTAAPAESARDQASMNHDDPHAPAPRNAYLLMGLGGAVLATIGISAIASILAPVLFALVLTICVHPLRDALERRGVPRSLATGSEIIAVFVLLLLFWYAIVIAIGQFTELIPQFAPEIQGWAEGVADWLTSIGMTSAQVGDLANGFDPSVIVDFVSGLLGGVTGWISLLVIILTMLVLMAMDAAFLPTLLRQLQPHRPLLVDALAGYASGVRRYMVVTTLLGLAQGIINWVALVVLGVPGAFVWGLLTFLCSFIPNVGYFIAIIPPIFFGGLVGGWPTVVAVVIVYGIVNAGVQSIVQPRVVGNAVALSQSLTFFSVLFWAVVIGPVGAILAIPLTLLVRTMLVDSNPSAAWARPLLGDFDETRSVMAAEDVEKKTARIARRAARRRDVST